MVALAAIGRGDLRLADFVKRTDNPKWGVTRTARRSKGVLNTTMLARITGVSVIGESFKLNSGWFAGMESAMKSVHDLPFPPVVYKPSRSKITYAGKYIFDKTGVDELFVSYVQDKN